VTPGLSAKKIEGRRARNTIGNDETPNSKVSSAIKEVASEDEKSSQGAIKKRGALKHINKR
jgi:hypothetical protein